MTRDYDPDDPVVGDEQVVEGDVACELLGAFTSTTSDRFEVWAALSTPKHPQQVADELTDIPAPSVYRYLRQLNRAGLIETVTPIPADRDPDDEPTTKYWRRIHDQLTLYSHDDEPCLVLSERPPYDPKRRLDEVNRDV